MSSASSLSSRWTSSVFDMVYALLLLPSEATVNCTTATTAHLDSLRSADCGGVQLLAVCILKGLSHGHYYGSSFGQLLAKSTKMTAILAQKPKYYLDCRDKFNKQGHSISLYPGSESGQGSNCL
eukprot:scaffold10306_cov75-Skeletonema_marinoi.AAC.8